MGEQQPMTSAEIGQPGDGSSNPVNGMIDAERRRIQLLRGEFVGDLAVGENLKGQPTETPVITARDESGEPLL